MPMTADDREYVAGLLRTQTEHFDSRLTRQDEAIGTVREIALDTRTRVVSLENTRSGVISAFVMAVVAVLGSFSLWLLSFLHWGAPKP